MTELLSQVKGLLDYDRDLLLVGLILTRTMPMLILTPFLGGKVVPAPIKMGFGVVLTLLIFPLARDSVQSIPLKAVPVLALLTKEMFVGLCLGFVNAHIFYALDIAGRLIDTVRGTAMSEVLDPHSGQRVTPTGDLYGQLFLVIFMVMGGHHIFIQGYFWSFKRFPLDKYLAFDGQNLWPFFDYLMNLTGTIFALALILSAPVMAATFISDVVFGILNRVAPQLNAYFMSMPVKAWGGIIMIFLAVEALRARFEDYVVWALTVIEKTMRLLFVD